MAKLLLKLNGKCPSKKNNYLMGKGRFFSDDKYKDYFNSLYYEIKNQMIQQKWTISTQKINLKIIFYADRRNDLDNLIGTICDVLQKANVIENDRQVVSIFAEKIFSKKQWTGVLISELG